MRCLRLPLLVGSFCLALAVASTSGAATRVVTNVDDSGTGSLRDAVEGAADGDTITFSDYFRLPRVIGVSHTIVIRRNIVIEGPGANRLTLSLRSQDTALDVFSEVTIAGLTVADALGALYVSGGNVTIRNCVFTRSLGFAVAAFAARLTVIGSTLSNTNGQGTIEIFDTDLVVVNSTFTGNRATVASAVWLAEGSTVSLDGVTIVDNIMSATTGGALASFDSTEPLAMQHTLMARNGRNVSGAALTSGGHNLDSDGTTGFVNGVNGDIVGTSAAPIDPLLLPFAYYGGPTPTFMPACSSPALNAGGTSSTEPTDQRGAARVVGGARDIGAVENQGQVTNTNDSGPGSLRKAITDEPSGATIDFALCTLPATISLTSGELYIFKPLTVAGPGAKLLTLDGNDNSRVLTVVVSGRTARTAISGMTVTGGNGRSGISTTGFGGGILVKNGEPTLRHLIITGNRSNSGGGNSGGGLAVGFANATVSDTTIAGNTASFGGGVHLEDSAAALTNCTVSGNAASRGAGINVSTSHALLRNTTIASNVGSGVRLEEFQGVPTLELAGTLIGGNTAGFERQGSSISTSLGHNLDSDGASGFTNGVNGDIVGTSRAPINARLGALADNGGLVPTHALLACSPAIDAGGDSPLVTDARGGSFLRVRDGDGDDTPVADIGAFEVQTPIACNRPTIGATPASIAAGTTRSGVTIATIADADGVGTLSVTATPLSGSGVALGSLSIAPSGVMSTTIMAACAATTSTWKLRVTDGEENIVEDTLTVTVTANQATGVTVSAATQTRQAGSAIANVVVQANDADTPGAALTIQASFTVNGGTAQAGLPAGLTLSAPSNNGATVPGSASWQLTGTMSTVGAYRITFRIQGPCGTSVTAQTTILVGYQFLGFQSPIPQSSYNTGSTIPVKFRLADSSGTPISDPTAQALASPCRVKVGLDTATSCAIYDAANDMFQFDVKVPKNASKGTHQIVVQVLAPDNSVVSTNNAAVLLR